MAIYTLEEYAQLKKKKKKVNGIENAITLEENMKRKGISLDSMSSGIAPISSDIAPIGTTVSKKDEEEKERKWFQKGAFKDGYQFGDVTKTILGSGADLLENVGTGILGMGEKTVDALAYLSPAMTVSQQAQNSIAYEFDIDEYRKMQDDSANFIKKDLYSEEDIAKKIITKPAKKIGIDAENQSVFGEKSDSLIQSAGQLGATVGLQALGVPWWLTTGGTSFGGEVETAFKEDATYGQAGGSALISAGAEILTEKLSGGIKFGGTTLDDVLLKPLTEKIANKTVRTITNLGLDAVGEGAEEVITSVISNLGTSLYKEESIGELLTSEEALDEYIESFIGGAVLGGGVSAITTAIESKNEKPKYTANEETVIAKEVENRIAELETDGTKLDKKAKSEIEKQVKKDLEKGYINIDTIESALGGETYNQYKSITEQEETLTKQLEELKNAPNTVGNAKLYEETENKLAELKKNSNKTQIKEQLAKEVQELTKSDLLIESYNEKARRSQVYEADLTKYDEKQQAVIKKAVESGILNNTNKTHEFVDMIARISADKGVSFDFTNNTKLKDSGFAIEGKTVNGYVKDGNIAVNIDSNKALNTVVGHEITHVLEGTELYTELQNVVKEYATTKGEYDTRYKALEELYKDVDGAVIENELTADLIGEYLFTDSDFINSLSTTKPNVFKKIYDEIKYLYKLATAGSKEARELEKVKRAFDKAYKESKANTTVNDVDFSLVGKENGIEVYETSEATKELSYKERKQKLLDTMKNEFAGRTAKFTKNNDVYYAFYDTDGLNKGVYGDKKSDKKGYKAKVNIGADGNYIELAENSLYVNSSAESGKDNRFHKNAKAWDYYVKTIKSDGNYYDVLINVKDTGNDQYVYDITLKETDSLPEQLSSYDGSSSASTNSIPQNKEKTTDIRYSVSENVQKAKDYFGTTYKVSEAGYLTSDGRMLDFSGKKFGGSAGYRSMDHREITDAFDGDYGDGSYSGGMVQFMQEGNIRLIPESGGINLAVKPNKEQLSALDRYISSFRGEVILDIDDANGNTVVSVEYPARTYSKKIINDINEYFDNGVIPEQTSSLGQFRYSLSEDNINKVTDDGLVMRYVRVPNKNTQYYGSTFGQNIEPAGEYMNMDDTKGTHKIEGYEYGTIQFKKPLVLEHINTSDTGWKKTVSDMYNGLTGKKLTKALIKDGYDAIVTYDEYGYSEIVNLNGKKLGDSQYSLGGDQAPTGNYRVYGKDIALETPENITEMPENSEKISETAPKNTAFEDYAPLTEEEANERDAMMGDRTYDVDYMPEEAEAPYYEETTETTEAVSPFEEKDIQDVGNRKQKAYMYENPEVKPYFQSEANVMLGELRNSVKGEKHFNDQLYYDSNGEQGWYGTKRETSEQIAYMLDKFKYTYADIEKGLRAIIEDHGAENNAISKRLEFMLDERLREGYTDFASGYEIPSNQEYINLLNEKQITEYSDEAYNRYLESLAYAEAPEVEAPVDEVQVLYSLEAQQQEKIAELDSVVETEDSIEATTLPTVESYDTKLENYKTALEGYKTARATIETSFDDVINKKTAEYNALKRKDTKKATTLLMQIENMKLRKSNNIATLDSKISKVESTIDKMSNGIPTKRQIYHRNIVDKIKDTFSKKGFDFDKILENAKNKGTFSSVDNTPQRFIEKSLGYKEGQILNDLTINKVAQNESKAIQWLNSYTDKKDGLLAQISKEYGIKPRSKESASAQMYAEGFYVDDDGTFVKYGDEELAKDYPNAKVRENIKKLAKDERVRKIYDDTLKMINESRKRNLYPEIPRRNNYFLHFREMGDTFSRLGIPFNPNDIRAKDLPTNLNGMTADLKPGQPYFASAKQRRGYKTTYDLVGGVERYLNSAKNQIYHIDDIQTLRALRNYLADRFGEAEGLKNLDRLEESEALGELEKYTKHLSNFAKFLNEEANVIAGKTTLVDRGLEGIIGRRGVQLLDTINRQVGSNMVGGNISSALTNTVSIVQSIAKTNKFDVTKAFIQTARNQLGSIVGKTDGFVENNPMMIRRKGIEKLQTKFFDNIWGKATDKGYLLMSAIDNISSEFIVRTKFNELTRKGMSEQQAHIEADKWASRILGDRSLGQQPQLYNSKMLGLITKFQLEVRNQLDSQFYDTWQEAKLSNEEIENRLVRNMKTTAKFGSVFLQLAVLQHIFGQAFESVAGYNPAFDIVEALSQMLGFDDEEESEDTVLDNIEEGFLTLLGDLPYTSTLTGGRIPIASALPVKQFVTGKDSYGNEKSRWETIKETAPYYLAPTGYGQWKKTKAGLEMFNEEHPIAGSYTKSGTLRFPVEDTPLNRWQAGIFGQYASENARDYFDNERKPLNAKQIQEYKDLDIPIRDYWEYREGLSGLSKLEDKAEYVNSLDLPIAKKNIMINNLTDRKEAIDMTGYDDFSDFEEFDYATKNPEKYEFLQENNISYEEYNASKESKELYNWYYSKPERVTMAKVVAGDLKTYRSYEKEINAFEGDDKKADVKNYIFNLDMDYGQKAILYRSKYGHKDDKNEYDNYIIDYLNSRNDLSDEEKQEIFNGLKW